MHPTSGGALGLTVALGLCLLAAAPLAAQTTSASVFGSVNDTQGGVLPGATVMLTSRTQANALTTTADRQGRFVFPIVRPDAYTLRVSREGFKTLERTNVVVNANDKFSAGILTLEVGVVAEEVSVTGRVSELQAHSGERSYTLEGEAIKDIANNGRAMFGFATLVPGVVPQASNGGVRIERPARDVVRLHRERAAAGLQQRHHRRRRQPRYRRQRRQHGHHQHRRRLGVQDPHERLPGGVRPRGGRADAGGHQERDAVLPRLRLLVRAAVRLERQHLDQQAGGGAAAGRERAAHRAAGGLAERLRVHDRRPHLHPGRLQRGQEEALLLLEPGVAEAQGLGRRAAEPGAHRARAAGGLLPERRPQREPVPLHPRLHDGAPVHRGRHAGLLPGRRRPGPDPPGPPLAAGPQRPEHLPPAEHHGLEVRLDAFNALNHTQFTGVNSTAAFASLSDWTITNLAYDASGNVVRHNGFGSITGVRPPRTLQLVTRLTF